MLKNFCLITAIKTSFGKSSSLIIISSLNLYCRSWIRTNTPVCARGLGTYIPLRLPASNNEAHF